MKPISLPCAGPTFKLPGKVQSPWAAGASCRAASSIHWRRRNQAAEAGTAQQRLLLGLCAGGTTFLLGPDVPFCPGPCWEVKQRVLMLAGRASLETGLKEAGFLLHPKFWVHQGDGPAGAGTGGAGTSDGGDLSSPVPFGDQGSPSRKQGFYQPPTSPGLSASSGPLGHFCCPRATSRCRRAGTEELVLPSG